MSRPPAARAQRGAAGRRPLRARDAARSAGFTLVEILAVVTILGFLAALILPTIGARSGRLLRDQAERLAADLELARERTIVTGVPHRVLLDLDGGAWRVEWYVTEAEALGLAADAPAAPAAEPDGRGRLDLSPPSGPERRFHPLPNVFGRVSGLEDDVRFAVVKVPGAEASAGTVAMTFGRDGSADPAVIVLADDDGRRVRLDVEALDERVSVRDDTTK